ncbi:MAG TPA: UDP-3-O-(3-hydroxymyristoyl)glucosamine N-acyltransferase [Gemmatimonadaceae bacterium]|nr:UDP-3-O-(3-hydroxymyristoyl)glucosamine N-acyltransferase [Gemmatimonadaceae bacterium]
MSSPERPGDVGGGGTRPLTADAVAALVGGTVVGDAATTVRAAAPLDRAQPDEVTFLASAAYAPLLEHSRAGIVLVAPELAEAAGDIPCRIVVASPHEAMLRLLPALYPTVEPEPGIHPTAIVGRGATLGADVSVGPYVVIGEDAVLGDQVRLDAHCSVGRGVHIGDQSRLFHGVTLYEGARIGRRVRLHAGVRIASDGFGYVFREGAHQKIPHVGRCIIEDDVEIGANTTIDRGSIDDTVIGAGTRIDNLVHIAHNVRVGRLCLIMAQVGIAGSCRIGDGAILAGQVGISGHHTIGAGARLAAQAGVFGDIPAGETWSGYPARPHKESLRAHAALFKLSGMVRQLERLLSREGQ